MHYCMNMALTPDHLGEKSETNFDPYVPASLGERISFLREKGNLTQENLAELLETSQANVTRWENGKSTPRQAILGKLATALGTSTDWLVKGKEPAAQSLSRPVVGFVGAGEAVYAFPEDNGPMDFVDIPFATPKDAVAVEVMGESMIGFVDDGDLLVYRRECPFILQDCINQRCIVQLEDDRVLVKRLKFGTVDGTFTLISTNAPPIENVRILWAAKILGAVYR